MPGVTATLFRSRHAVISSRACLQIPGREDLRFKKEMEK